MFNVKCEGCQILQGLKFYFVKSLLCYRHIVIVLFSVVGFHCWSLQLHLTCKSSYISLIIQQTGDAGVTNIVLVIPRSYSRENLAV